MGACAAQPRSPHAGAAGWEIWPPAVVVQHCSMLDRCTGLTACAELTLCAEPCLSLAISKVVRFCDLAWQCESKDAHALDALLLLLLLLLQPCGVNLLPLLWPHERLHDSPSQLAPIFSHCRVSACQTAKPPSQAA